MIYLDSCALIKLVREENESAALQDWLDERAIVPMFTSELANAEVVRTVRRSNHTSQGVLVDADKLATELGYAAEILESVEQVVIGREVVVRAGALEAPMLRTLDAIHLSSAIGLGIAGVDFVTYDRRLAAAAERLGFAVVAPRG